MSRTSKNPTEPTAKKGQALALAAVMTVVLLGTAALAVDLGYFFVTRNELQNIADGSALAGTRTLGNIYQGLPYPAQQGYVCDAACETAIRDASQAVAANNRAAGEDMTARVEDIAIGQWDGNTFTPTLTQPDAVEVITRRDEVANGPVTTFFARVLGIQEGTVTAIATAALSGQSTAEPGEIELPIGLSEWFFTPPNQEWCDDEIVFHPTNDPLSCAGWTSWEYGSNDVTLRSILDEDEGYESPGTVAGETIFNFIGGDLSVPTFDALLSLFQRKGFDVDVNWNYLLDNISGLRVKQAELGPGLYHATDENGDPYPTEAVALMEPDNGGVMVRGLYPDGTPRNWHRWDTTVPVYDRDDCSNPNQSILIVGFAPIELRDVLNAPDKLVKGIVRCDYVDPLPSRGGGGEYGIKGSIPGLVR
jgi:Flp pilus assembly protein TadG